MFDAERRDSTELLTLYKYMQERQKDCSPVEHKQYNEDMQYVAEVLKNRNLMIARSREGLYLHSFNFYNTSRPTESYDQFMLEISSSCYER